MALAPGKCVVSGLSREPIWEARSSSRSLAALNDVDGVTGGPGLALVPFWGRLLIPCTLLGKWTSAPSFSPAWPLCRQKMKPPSIGLEEENCPGSVCTYVAMGEAVRPAMPAPSRSRAVMEGVRLPEMAEWEENIKMTF